MTSAARPTWNSAMGGYQNRDTASAPTKQVSVRSLPAHTKLKTRQPGQNAQDEVNERDLKKQLEEAELKATKGKRIRDDDEEDGGRKRREAAAVSNIDADDSDIDDDDDEDSSDKSDQDDDDEDDTAELLRELEKIKRERAEEKERQDRERSEAEEKLRQEQIASGNPLLNLPSASTSSAPKDFSVKRRWDDDVIFKNQAKGMDEQPKKRFINDMLRSDFHKKFMNKYVK
ncbi:hypothetical protein SeMB42_g01320 [Synchytrium endobioticum]|uniref:Cwf15/Cwc15 cell cycle control protein n=1 Tax=Synchytrium endobioticum TaxID=286115 RepID=A0A507DBY9_9FUNG|nr:hypothetical protein SeLEV6574_g01601 [Synchytrium endobioticum]TPX52583.1 hypothetical protein SeMB42_g01320 [Synchytrium endobioticum]